MADVTPNKQYFVQLPDENGGQTWDEEKFNRNKEQLFNDEKNAVVFETSPLGADEEISEGSIYAVRDPMTGDTQQWDGAKLARNRKQLMKDIPNVQITRATPVNYWGDKLTEIYDRMDRLDKELEGLPEDTSGADLRNADDSEILQYASKAVSPDARRRREIRRELDQLRAEREQNPAWQSYWSQQNEDIDNSLNRVGRMQTDLDLSNPKSGRLRRDPSAVFGGGTSEIELAMDMKANPDYYRDQQALVAAKQFYDDAKKVASAPSRYDDKEGIAEVGKSFSNYWKGVVDNAWDALSVVSLAKAINNLPLIGAVRLIQENEGEHANIQELIANDADSLAYLSDAQKEMLRAFVRKAEVESGRSDNMSLAYQAGQSSIQSVGFMADFVMAGGLGDAVANKAVGKVVGKAAEKALAKGSAKTLGTIGADALHGLVKSAVMSPVMPSTYGNILNNITQFNDAGSVDLSGKAVLRAVGDALIENVSETIGAKPLELLGWGAGKAIPTDWIGKTKFGAWAKALRHTPMFNVMKQAGWNGFVEEMFEEVSGNALRVITGIDKDALKDFAQVDQLLITSASFAPMSLIGGGVSSFQLGRSSRNMKNAGVALSDLLSSAKVDKNTIDRLMNIDDVSTPEELASHLAEAYVTAVENGADPAASFKAVQAYTDAASKYKTMAGIFQEKEDNERQQAFDDLSETYGTFWQGDEETGRTVVRVGLPDGRQGYVLNTDESGMMTVKFDDGSNGFASEADGAMVRNLTLDQYLDGTILAARQEEDDRQLQEREGVFLNEMAERISSGQPVQLGTDENPIAGSVVGRNQAGEYIVQTEDGQQVAVSERQLAEKLGIELPKTREQQESDDAARYEADIQRKDLYNTIRPGTEVTATLEGMDEPVKYNFVRAIHDQENGLQIIVEDQETGKETSLPESAFIGLEQLAAQHQDLIDEEAAAAEKAERSDPEERPEAEPDVPRDFRGNPLPLKDDSRVDQNTLWNRDPEAWAAWNDSQRQDDGANTVAYVKAAAKKVQGELTKAQKQYDKELDFDRREAIEGQMTATQDRLTILNSVLRSYDERAKAAQEQQKEAERTNTVPSSEAQSEEKSSPTQLSAVEQRERMDPRNPVELAAAYFKMLGTHKMLNGRLNKADFKRELGWGEEELKRFFPWWAKKGRGFTLVNMAEEMANDFDTFGIIPSLGDAEQKDTQAARSAIIELFASARSPRDIYGLIEGNRMQEEQAADGYGSEEADAQAMAEYGVTAAEEMRLQALWDEETEGYAKISDEEQEEFNNFTADYYEFYEPRTEQEAAGELLESTQGGAEDMQGLRTDRAGGIPGVEGREAGPANVDVGYADERRAVPAEASVGDGSDNISGGSRSADSGNRAEAGATEQGITRNSALDNTTDTGETSKGSERNDTATPQDTVSDGKDTEISGETKDSAELTDAQVKALAFIDGKTEEQVREEHRQRPLKNRIREWEDRTGVKVVAYSSIDEVESTIARMQINLGTVSGWFDPRKKDGESAGTVYLYLPDIKDVSDLDKSFLHEVISHKGLREMLGERQFDSLMDHVWGDLMSEDEKRSYLDYIGSTGEQASEAERRAAADEYVARLAENIDTNPTAWQKFVAFFKEALLKLGVNVELNENDLSAILQASLARYERLRKEELEKNEAESVLAGIETARQEVDTDPSDAQKEAGNYKKGHIRIDGYDITIENPKGSVRRGVDADGNAWETPMNNDYGYIRGTQSVDGDHIDVFLSENPTEGNVFVVDQVNPATGEFDEHKVMYGFPDAETARAAYLSNYSEGWQGLGTITEVTKDEFKKWVDSSKRKTKPFSEYKSVKTEGAQKENDTASSTEATKSSSGGPIDILQIAKEEAEKNRKSLAVKAKDKKIEDFGEKIGGARKDAARARINDSLKMSVEDLAKMKDPDKILSRKSIIKYLANGEMTYGDATSLLAANMAVRSAYGSGGVTPVFLTKYRDMASAWEQGKDLSFEITDKDVDALLDTFSERTKQLPNIRKRMRESLDYYGSAFEDYKRTYEALDYPNTMRELKSAVIRETRVDGRFWVKAGFSASRGFPFRTFEQAVQKIKQLYPEKVNVEAEARKVKESGDAEIGHLKTVKDEYGWYRIKSSLIPGTIYLSGKLRSRKEAESYLKENAERLVEREEAMVSALMGSNIGMVQRQGRDYRNGKDVSGDTFMETFSPRGIEFGNWVPQAERQEYLNKTYDAIMDFCEVVGISPKAFFLGGKLALSFGARGHSRALAHYEPLKEVINLTRMSGAGSLAHEWFHALDNYMAKQKTGNTSDMATDTKNTVRAEVASAFRDLVKAMDALDYTSRSENAGDYWGSVWERTARMFEDYTYMKLGGQGVVSPLLVRESEGTSLKEGSDDYISNSWPYPTRQENDAIKPYFDRLFDAIQEEEGTGVLFRKTDGSLKDRQFAIINESNPMTDDVHTGIRSVEDIKTWSEAVADARREAENGGWEELASYPDITNEMVEQAEEDGMVTIYSSYPISNGVFVTPSRMQAEEYAGYYGEVFSKHVPVSNVAWINLDEGQYSEVEKDSDVRFRKAPNGEETNGSRKNKPVVANVTSLSTSEKKRINTTIDKAVAFISNTDVKTARQMRIREEEERKAQAAELYSRVLNSQFDDVTLRLIDEYIENGTPKNPYGRRISKRLPQEVERGLYEGERTGAVDALFSRISESAVPASRRTMRDERRRISRAKKEALKGWAIATGNWHTDLSEFTNDTEPFASGSDSDVYYAKDGTHVIKASKGKSSERKFSPDPDNIPLFNYIFPNTAYRILGYGEIDGHFVRILEQPLVEFGSESRLSSDERVDYMASLGFEPINKDRTVFSNSNLVVADLQKSNIVFDKEWNVRVIDADVKLHTKDVGGEYTYPPVEDDIPEGTDLREDGSKDSSAENPDIRFRQETVNRMLGENRPKPGPTAAELIPKVQSFGLRGILDKELVGDYYNSAYRLMPEDVRGIIVDRAFGNDLNIRRQIRNYIADLAAKGYEKDESGLLRAMADRLRELISTDQQLGDNELLYMMWRDAKRYTKQDILGLAQDIALRKRLGIGEFSGEQFPGEAKQVVASAAENVQAADEARSAARKEAGRDAKKSPFAAINAAMTAQRKYDRETVSSIVDLAKQMIKSGNISSVTAREMARLMTIIKDANGRRPATVVNHCKQLMDFMVDHTIDVEKDLLDKMMKIKTAIVKAPGVDVQAKLDLHAQAVVNTFRDSMSKPEAQIRQEIDDLEEKLESDRTSEVRKEEIRSQLDGLSLALQFATTIAANEADNTAIREGLRESRAEYEGMSEEDKKRRAASLKEESDVAYDAIRKNKIDRVTAYRELRAALAEAISSGADRAKSFLEKERERVAEIHHAANADMEGVDDNPIEPKVTGIAKMSNNPVVRFLTSPLSSFDQMLRMLGRRHVDGRGYLWTRFMTALRNASDNEKRGLDAANEQLNAKVQEIFGDPKMTWNDLYSLERGMEKAKVRFFNANGKWVEEELTAGNLLYIYMVNKMSDGQMKLRQMGITEQDVLAIERRLDKRFLDLADWIQGEFLPGLRDKYNEVHKRMFGTSMAAIDNYFPLRILGGVIREEVDLSNTDSNVLPSAMTGAIIKRTVNRKQLDITGTDAFSTVIEHIREMEHWAAYAEVNRDLGTLLSYKRFQNQMKHLKTIYGSGNDLWGTFKKTTVLAAGEYRPANTALDKAVLNIAKGVTAAKISFRAYTALKQILSFPAFFADAKAAELGKAVIRPMDSWRWAMENLPNFKKRVESRKGGNEILEDTDLDSKFWDTKFAKFINRYGMSMNAFVDALTVSIGSKAVYESKLGQYLSEGFPQEQAETKAKMDAVTAFNETQQSSEKEFLSLMQADRTVASVAMSVYRNSSFGYQRQVHHALRTLGRMAQTGYKEESVAFMAKQLVREGLTEEQALAAAEKRYDRAGYQAVVRIAVFGFVTEFAWNLGAHAVYLLFGDDPDEKKAMLEDDAMKALLGGSIEGLAGGSIISEMASMKRSGKGFYGYDMNTLPIMSDIQNLARHWNTDPVAAANELVYLAAQIGIGTNPQTMSDAIVAIIDACRGDMTTAKEAMFCILRILAVPQSQLDQLMIDEIGMSAKDASELTFEDIAKRYADYKMMRNAPVTGVLYSDELRRKREKSHRTTFKKKVNERKDLQKKKMKKEE